MIGAKAMDPVLGVDIHIIQPPGPVPPVPVPHPFVGMLIDPMDFAPVIGATVMINGMPRATAGTGGMCVPPHIPIGGVFVKPPGNECEVFMGSATVLADGDPLGRLGSPALSCHDVGMPPPPRLKKKRKPKSLTLPTSVVLAVPAGAPVLVGGPPTISMMALGMKAAMAGLGKAFKKLRKLQKASRRMKGLSKKVHAAAQKAMTKLGVPPSIQNKVHRAVCTVTGHPVDVATGKMYTEAVDFEVAGPLPFVWERVWYSCSVYDGPLGHGWHHSYDLALLEEEGALALRMADGRGVAFRVPAPGEVEENEQEGLALWRDEEGYAVRDRAGCTFRFARVGRWAVHALQSVTDPQGARILFHYDAGGRLTHAIDSTGRPIVFAYDDRGRITEIHAPRPGSSTQAQLTVRYVYDAEGELVTAIDALGQPFHYTYRNHLLVRETDRRGYTFHFRYDGETTGARCTATWGEDGLLAVSLEYQPDRTFVTFDDGGRWTYLHDERGLVTDRIDPYGEVVRFEHDDAGRVTQEIRPDGDSTRHEYADTGVLIRSVGASGRNESAVEEEEGEAPEILDPNAYSLPEGVVHWELGELLEGQPRAASASALPPDAPLPVREAAVVRAAADGRPEDPAREEVDPLGRLTRRRYADGTYEAWAYDPEGNVIASRDRDGAITRYTYGSRNLLVAVTDPLGGTARYAYSSSLEVTRATDPGGTEHVFEHDLKDRNTAILTAGQRTDVYVYDGADHLVERRDGSGRRLVTSEVGPGGVELRRVLEDGEAHEFEYDDAGRLVAAQTPEFTASFAYAADGEQIEDLRDDRGIRHSRAADGSLSETRYLDRFKVTYARDPADSTTLLVTDPTGGIHSFSVVSAGAMLKQLGDGACEFTRYARGGACLEKLSWRLGSPEALRTRRYSYSPGGDLLEAYDSAAGTRRFVYDAAHRLSREDREGAPGREYAFDAAGNLLRQPGLTGVKIGVANRLEWASGDRFEYDDRGRLVARSGPGGKWLYRYNALDQLTRIEIDGEVWEACYDPLGRRVSRSWRGQTTHYWWDDFRLAAEERSDGSVRLYLYPDLKALVPFMFVDYANGSAPTDLGRRYYLFTDQVGAPVRVEDGKGREVWSAEIDPFGTAHVATGARLELSLRFPGHYFDPETGLHYNRFRYYSPDLGRYLQPDPLGFEDSLNVYAYSPNPLTVVDLDGLAGYKGGKTKARRRSARSKAGGTKGKPKPRAPRPKTAKKLSPKKLQEAADKIQAVGSRRHPKNHKLTTTTVTQGVENGKVVHTVTNSRGSVSAAQKKKAREVLGPDTRFPRESRGKRPNNGHHAERRGIRGTRGQKNRQQASSSGAGHGGASCGHCTTAQRSAGVENVTGTQSGGGRIR